MTIPGKRSAGKRSLVLVLGRGRGPTVLGGILSRLGFRVSGIGALHATSAPPAAAESKQLAQLHADLLDRAGVRATDARPAAWAETARIGLDSRTGRELRRWLASAFRRADDIAVVDPNTSWFLPAWRRSSEAVGAATHVVVILEPVEPAGEPGHPAHAWENETTRLAAWVNRALFVERATREEARAFVRYDDLLDDWAQTVARLAQALDFPVVEEAPWRSLVRADEFMSGPLAERRDWNPSDALPDTLRNQAEEAWRLLSELARGDADVQALLDGLDRLRSAYVRLYAEAAAVADSSIWAAGRKPPPAHFALEQVRNRLPARWRARVARIVRR